MQRDYGKEIDNLKEDLSEIKALLKGYAQGKSKINAGKKIGHVEKMEGMHPDPHIMAIMDNLENDCGEKKSSGSISYLGVFASGNRQSSWVRNTVNTDILLKLIEDKTAEKVLNCIGNSDRLNILLAILKKPRTVAELVEECGLNSTGGAYHHMKPLLAADLISEVDKNDGKGRYIIKQQKVQGIIMLLAGISDMVDNSYTTGILE